MKDFLKKLIVNKEAEADNLRTKIKRAQTADEVRALGETLNKILQELDDAKKQLEELDKSKEGEDSRDGANAGEASGEEGRSLNPMATFSMATIQRRKKEDVFGTTEYRMAFKSYVQRGTPIPQDLISRAGGDTGTTLSTELGAIIPTTIMEELIKEASKVYGQIYSKVRKLNIKGGVEFPVAKLKASFKWITESTVSEKQKAGDITEKVSFKYNIGEIRLAETLLANVVTLELFEQEMAKLLVEAYVEAMDKGIISGTGSGQLLGITADPRVTNVVQMNATDIADWTVWRKQLFAKIPLSKRGQGEFLFPASTVESYLLTMQDANKRPLFREATEGTVGNTAGTFFGRSVTLVEPDVIKDFDTASTGDVIGVYWVPQDYAINTNMQFGVKRYFDEDTNEYINKGLTIVDGKILDTSGCYLIKKKA